MIAELFRSVFVLFLLLFWGLIFNGCGIIFIICYVFFSCVVYVFVMLLDICSAGLGIFVGWIGTCVEIF